MDQELDFPADTVLTGTFPAYAVRDTAFPTDAVRDAAFPTDAVRAAAFPAAAVRAAAFPPAAVRAAAFPAVIHAAVFHAGSYRALNARWVNRFAALEYLGDKEFAPVSPHPAGAMVTIQEFVEDGKISEVGAGHTGNAVGAGSAVFDPSVCSHSSDPSSSTARSHKQAVSLVTAERLGGLASQDKGQGPSAFDTCSDTHVTDDDKDDGGPDHVLSVKYGGDDEAPVVQQHQQAPAPVVQQQQQAPEILQQPPLVQEDDGFTLVRSRKFGWIRKRFPEGPYVAPADKVCGNEFPWVPKVGPPSEVKKWSQARKGVYLGTTSGEASFTFGTFGPTSLER